MERLTVKHRGAVAMGELESEQLKDSVSVSKGGTGQTRSICEQIHPGGHGFAILVTRARPSRVFEGMPFLLR